MDGQKLCEIHPVFQDIRSNQLVIGYVTFNLAKRKHTVKINTLKCQKDGCNGEQVLLYNLIIGNKK